MEARFKGFAISSVASFIVFSCLFSAKLVCVVFSLLFACIVDTIIRIVRGDSPSGQQAVNIPRIQEDSSVFEEVESTEENREEPQLHSLLSSECRAAKTADEKSATLQSAQRVQELNIEKTVDSEGIGFQETNAQITHQETELEKCMFQENDATELIAERQESDISGKCIPQEAKSKKSLHAHVDVDTQDQEVEEPERTSITQKEETYDEFLGSSMSDSTTWKWDREDIDLNDPEVMAAATKIQATFRGHQVRKAKDKKEEDEAEDDDVANIDLTDPDLAMAATKIQASFRGHITRKQAAKENTEKDLNTELEKLNTKDEEEVDLDLTDPDLQKAAVKIQASFRGHLVRKDNEDK